MNKASYWLRLEVWWFILTAVYCFFVLMGLGWKLDCFDVCTNPPNANGVWWVNFIGLFVPVGPNNAFLVLFFPIALLSSVIPSTLAMILGASVIAILLYFFMRWLDKAVAKVAPSPLHKAVANLGTLLAITLVVDLLLLKGWASMNIFLQSL